MPLEMNDVTYYRMTEACNEVGISRSTLIRWLNTGVVEDVLKDRNGWRLFTLEDIARIRTFATRVTPNENI